MKNRLEETLIELGYDYETVHGFVDGLDASQLQRTVGQLVRDFYLIFNVE